jgi:hypothetical protein
MTTYIYGYACGLRSTTDPPRVGPRLGDADRPRAPRYMQFKIGGGTLSFKVVRGRAEEWTERKHGIGSVQHVYAREVPPELELEVYAAEDAVRTAERVLEKARAARQETLLAVAQRSKPARAPKSTCNVCRGWMKIIDGGREKSCPQCA